MTSKLLMIIALAFLTSSCGRESKPKLHVFIWSNSIKPELIESFEKETHCQVVLDTYDSNESMYAKLKLGASGYDVLLPSNYYLDLMQRQGMLHPLDLTLLPNKKNVDPAYLKLIGSSSLDYGVPFLVSITGIGYRKDKIDPPPSSWSIFGRHDLKGRMTMLNDPREVLGAALKYLGYSPNTKQAEEIRQATQLLIEWKKNLAKFESEQYKNGLASVEFLVVQGYSGDVLQVIQENSSVSFIYPEEGTMISVDSLVITKNSNQTALAHAFINYLLKAEVAAENIAYTFYLNPNTAAYEHLSPSLRANPILFPSQDILNKSEVIKDVGEAFPLYSKAWDAVKAAD